MLLKKIIAKEIAILFMIVLTTCLNQQVTTTIAIADAISIAANTIISGGLISAAFVILRHALIVRRKCCTICFAGALCIAVLYFYFLSIAMISL